ncbi:MAG: hypothetical protein P4L81_04330 [Candidatus Pacebacteria bacterium]|nr:hypothetical protein [Candidatus Paceibacterota bacterium]
MPSATLASLDSHDKDALPTAKELQALLNALSVAQDAGKSMEMQAKALENQILNLAQPGIYEGYLGDDLTFSFVRLLQVKRMNRNANIHTFRVELEVLEDETCLKPQEMDLIDFLGEVFRTTSCERQHRGRRFWRF